MVGFRPLSAFSALPIGNETLFLERGAPGGVLRIAVATGGKVGAVSNERIAGRNAPLCAAPRAVPKCDAVSIRS